MFLRKLTIPSCGTTDKDDSKLPSSDYVLLINEEEPTANNPSHSQNNRYLDEKAHTSLTEDTNQSVDFLKNENIPDELKSALEIINTKLQGLHKTQSVFLKGTGITVSFIDTGFLIYAGIEKNIPLSIVTCFLLLTGMGITYAGYKPNSWFYRYALHSNYLSPTFPCQTELPNVVMAGELTLEEKQQISKTIEKYNNLELLQNNQKINASLEKIDYAKLREQLIRATDHYYIIAAAATNLGARFLYEAKQHLFFTANIPAPVIRPILEYLDCPKPNDLLQQFTIK